jgi:hypothetical protein
VVVAAGLELLANSITTRDKLRIRCHTCTVLALHIPLILSLVHVEGGGKEAGIHEKPVNAIIKP